MKKERNSSLELLRVLAMVFIICSHFCGHSGFGTEKMNFSFNKILLQIGMLGSFGVVIFVMISGYFLSQLSFKLSRMVKIILQVVFYSMSIYLILTGLKVIQFSIVGLIESCFPILFTQYWFASTYVVFVILTPFVNILLENFSKKQYICFLLGLLFIWSIVPTFTGQPLESNALCQFLLFYSIGAFARKYPDIMHSKKLCSRIATSLAILLILSTLMLNLLAMEIPTFNIHGTHFYGISSILIISLAFELLLIFANMRIRTNRLINLAGASTFGIYLIHDNRYLRGIIWKNIFNTKTYQDSPYLVFYLVLCIAIVFLVCGIIDCIRQKLLEKPLMSLLDSSLKQLTIKVLQQIDKLVLRL